MIKKPRGMSIRLYGMTDADRGLARFELVITISLISVLTGIFAQRFLYLQEYAEKTVMEATVVNIRSGLRYKLAELIVEERSSEIPALMNENPIQWLERPPENYVGEFEHPERAVIPSGSWYFNKRHKQLVYRLNRDSYFDGPGEVSEICFRVGGVAQSLQTGEAAAQGLSALKFEGVTPASWFGEKTDIFNVLR